MHLIVIHQMQNAAAKAAICENVLRGLPDWFGIEAATLEYIKKAQDAPFFAAFFDEHPIGFVYLYAHNAFSVEIYCMGVMKQYHREGVGKKLVDAAEQYCSAMGARYLTVKTLADTHPDEGYQKTRQFYLSMGFTPLEVFADLWGKENPCLFLAKSL